jgi:UDP-N-acetylglucosamine 3-dehydrogenase
MGQNHARVLAQKGVLGSVADTCFEKAKSVGDRFSVEAYANYKEALAGDLDAVVIATPTSTHERIARYAIEEGKHVLLEKPMTGDSKVLRRLTSLAEKRSVVLSGGFIERYNPVVDYTRRSLDTGEYGDLITASTRRVSTKSSRVTDIGVILDLGVHDIDVLRYLVKTPVESVYALGGSDGPKNHENHANILLDFGDHITGFVEVNWLTPMKVRRFSLTCGKNYVEADYMDQSVVICSSSFKDSESQNLYDLPLESYLRKVSLKKEEPLMREIKDFLAASEKGSTPLVTAESAIETLQIAEAALESMRTGHKTRMR